MLNDVFSEPQTLVLDDETYTMEFDNKAYAMMEHKTGKSAFELFYSFVEGKPLLNDCLDALHCALLKNHKSTEIKKVIKVFSENRYLLMENLPSISFAYIEGLLPPDVLKGNNEPEKTLKKKTSNKTTKKNVKV